ncbi:LamG-like jellyroll fold domain-containing protein [Actinoplanes sp. NPDC049668]|uniref:LamG-like jellyroll fold domain-containing protein n=1 Tax=unclassified Actinoplanes TaxID=2626549 RepID=UPI0033B15562
MARQGFTQSLRARRRVAGLTAVLLGATAALAGVAPPALAQPPLDQRACAAPRPDEAAAVKAARECRRTVEITDLTTETDRAWAEPDGTITWEHRYRPVRVRRGEAWVDVDTTLRREAGGRVGPRAAAADVTFSDGGTGPLVVLGRGAARISIGSPFGRLPRPVLSGDTATYENVRPGVDLVLRADVDGFRARADAAGELRLRTTGAGLTARAGEHGDIRIVDGAGEPVLHGLGAGVRGRDLVVAPGGQLSLTLGRSAWSELDSSSPDTARWNAPGPARAGRPAAGTGVYRSVFGADLARSAVAGRNVVAGRLRVAPAEGAGCAAAPVELWAAGPLRYGQTWADQPRWAGRQGSAAPDPAAGCVIELDATAAAKAAAASRTALTLGLRSPREQDPAAFAEFDNNPTLVLSIAAVAPVVGARTMVPDAACTTGTGRPVIDTAAPELRAVITDADGGTLSATIEWWAVTGTAALGSATVGGLTTGKIAATAVPDGALANNGNYKWRVRATDGTLTSAWSGFCEFTVRVEAPGQPYPALAEYDAWAGRPAGVNIFPAGYTDDRYLLAHWPLNDGSGQAAADTAFLGRSPLAVNGATWAADAGGSYLNFNGTSQYAKTTDPVLPVDEGFTVMAWVKVPAGTTGNRTVLAQEGTRGNAFALQYAGATKRWVFSRTSADTDAATTTSVTSVAEARTDVWTHLAGAYDPLNRRIALYVNGLEVATAAFTTPWPAREAFVVGRGKRAGAAADWWSGAIDDVRAYNWFLNFDSVAHYAGEAGYEFQLDGAAAPTVVPARGTTRLELTLPEPGDRTLTVWARNRAGLRSEPAQTSFHVNSASAAQPPAAAMEPALPCVTGPGRPVLRTTTPTLSGTLGTADRYYNAGFAVEPLTAPGGFISGSGYGQGPKVSWQVPPGKLANKASYRWRVDFSGVGENWENSPRSAPCEFTVDAPVPNPPAVSSPDYPKGDERHGAAGQPGAFTFGQAVDESQAALRAGFNEGSGAVAENEFGGPATLSGGAGRASGPTGAALSLNGTGAYASTESRVVNPGTDFTVGAWVRPTGLGASATALSQHSTVQSIFRLGYSKTDNRWALIQPATNTTNAPVAKALSTSVPQAGVWTHLVGVHDSARKQLRLYVNGRLEGTAFYTTPLRDIEMPFQIGRGLINGAPAEYWPGQIDDAVAWTRRLGDAEITELARPVSYTYQLDGQAAAEAPDATGAAKVTITPDRNGTRTLTVRARSAAGELSAPSTYRFRVGTTGVPDMPVDLATVPATSCATGADRPYLTTATPQLRALADDPDWDRITTTFEWWAVGGDKVGEASVTDWASYTATVTVPAGQLADGTAYAWRARGADETGAGPWSPWCEFTVDTSGPQPPAVSSQDFPADGTAHGNEGIPGRFTLTPADGTTDLAGFDYRLDTDAAAVEVAATGARTVLLSPAAGARTLTVRAKDRAGHWSEPATYSFVVGPPLPYELVHDAAGQLVGAVDPRGDTAAYDYDRTGNLTAVRRYPSTQLSVLSTIPVRGAPGTRLSVHGTGFSASDTVTVNGVAAPVVEATSVRLVVTVPDAATTGTVRVSRAGGASADGPAPFTVVVDAAKPAVTGFSPASGPAGTSVTITGTGFAPETAGNTVAFNRTRARVTAASRTSLTVLVPDAVTAGPVSVRTAGGLATTVADYLVPPPGVPAETQVDGGRVTVGGAGVTTTVPGGRTAVLRFSGTAGQKLSLAFSGNTVGAAKVALHTPYGQTFAAGQYDKPRPLTGNQSFALPPLPTAGTYSIAVDPDGAAAGSLTVTLSTQVTGQLSTTGAGTPMPLDRVGRHGEFTFTAAENQRFSFAFADWTFPSSAFGVIRLYTPYGTEHLNWTVFDPGATGSFTTPWPGTWRFVVGTRDLSVGSATMWLSEQVDGGAIAVGGASVGVTVARPGQAVRLGFDGTAGQRLGLGFTGISGLSYPLVGLVDPSGREQSLAGGEESDLPALTAAGRHELVLSAPKAGALTVWLSADLDAGALAIGAPVPVSLSRPGQNIRLRFDGTAGQRLSLGFGAKTLEAYLRTEVSRPGTAGRLGLWTALDNVDLPLLLDTGTHEVFLDPDRAATGELTLALSAEIDAGEAGTGVPATHLDFAAVGQNARLRFTATAGQRLSLGFTGAGAGLEFVYATVLKPDGTQLGSASSVYTLDDKDLGALPATGVYQVVFDPYQGRTGPLDVTLSEEVAAGALTVGGAGVPVSVVRPGQDARLTLAGTAGQRARLAFSDGTLNNTWVTVRVLAPDGGTFLSDRLRTAGQTVDLPAFAASGDYAVVLDPYNAGVGQITIAATTLAAAAPTGTDLVRAAAADLMSALAPRPAPVTAAAACAPAGAQRSGPPPALVPTAGSPVVGWAACPPVRAAAPKDGGRGTPPRPAGGWRPGADNLAGKGWTTGYGPAAAPGGLAQAPAGVTALAGQVRTVDGRELGNVAVAVGAVRGRTDAHGRFLLAGVTPGHRVLRVDGRTASTRAAAYGVFDIGVDIGAGTTLALPYTIWMQALDPAATVSLRTPTDREVVLTTSAIPGLEVHVPAGTIVRDGDGKVARELNLTAIPVDRPPFPLPESNVPVYFTIQPGGGSVFPAGVQLVYPNYTKQAPGTRMNFWSYDPEGAGWHVYGKGTVTADGRQVRPDADTKVYRFTGAMTVVPGYNPPPKFPSTGGGARSGDPVDLATGLMVDQTTDLEIDDVVPLKLTRTYQQGDPETRAFGIGMNFNYNLYPWSSAMLEYREADLILADGARVHFRRISPGSGNASYESAIFLADPTPTEYHGATLAWNGNGWDVTLVDGTVVQIGDEAPLQAIRDKYGNTTTITRAPMPPDANGTVRSSGRITQITSPNGKWIKLTYDAQQRVTRAEDNSGRGVDYTYTADGYLWTVTNPAGGVTTYTWEAGRLKSIRDPRNIVYNTNTYDSAGRVRTQQDGTLATWQFDYTTGTDGKVTTTRVTDPRGHVRRVTFDGAGQVVTDTAADGTALAQTVSVERDPGSPLPRAVTDQLGRRTEYEYDVAGNPTAVTELAGTALPRVTRYTYNGPFRQLDSVTNPLGKVTRYTYDERGALTARTDPTGRTVRHTVNDAGQNLTTTDDLGRTTTVTYEQGEPATVTDPAGRISSTGTDQLGRVTRLVAPGGAVTTTRYDALGRVLEQIDPLERSTSYEYDGNGNRRTVRDARNHATTFTFDNADRVKTVTDPLGKVESYDYDGNGNVVRHTSRRGKVSTFEFDDLDRGTVSRYGVSGSTVESTVTTGYDAGDRIRTVTDATTGKPVLTTTYTPDDHDRIRTVSQPNGVVSYDYDLADRLLSMQTGGQPAQRYGYDDADRLTSVEQDGRVLAATTYDEVGRPGDVRRGDYHQTYAYDRTGEITTISYRHGERLLGYLNYGYDDDGQRARFVGDLAQLTIPAAFGPATYDDADQLKTLPGRTLTYDDDGNLTADGTSSYTWNARGELSASSRTGLAASFTYDGEGNRTAAVVGGTTRGYTYDGANPVRETVGGTGSNLVATGTDQYRARVADTGAATSFLTDALGSVIALGDESGALVARYSYDPFGQTAAAGADGGNTLRYTGREDDGTGLYYHRARYYDPALHRFISRDPLGFDSGQINQYAYVGNNPVSLIDPLGTAAKNPGLTATQYKNRKLPNVDNPWKKYQKHVTGRNYEESWKLSNGRKVQVDGRRAGYIVEAKWTGNEKQWSSSNYNPNHAWYDEAKYVDQASRLLKLNEAIGGKGVRYAVSNEEGRAMFQALFEKKFPQAVQNGTLRVYVVPGNGM